MTHELKHVELSTDETVESKKSRDSKMLLLSLHNFCLPILIRFSPRDFSRLFFPFHEQLKKQKRQSSVPSQPQSFVPYRLESNRFVDGNQNKLNENFERLRGKQKPPTNLFSIPATHSAHIRDFVS